MATTDHGRRLSVGYRIAQDHVAAAVTHDLTTIWRLLDAANLDSTAPRWLTNALSVVERHRSTQAALTGGYLQAFRAAELPDATPITIPPAPPINRRAVMTSLTVTGPVAVRQRIAAGYDLEEATSMSAAGSASAGTRHVLNVGRDLTLATLRTDDRATGWNRITSGNACDFCDQIAAEGPFSFDADFPAHDRCGCFAEPEYLAA